MNENLRPVVALDVDGVINATGPLHELPKGWQEFDVDVPAALVPKSPFVPGRGETDLTAAVHLNAALHGPWITRLRKHADVVWATTWEGAANVALAPLLGIDPLPVGIAVDVQVPRHGASSTEWKIMALTQAFPGRPLAWVDDMNDFRRLWVENEPWRYPAPTAIITAERYYGLTESEMTAIDDFVDRHRA